MTSQGAVATRLGEWHRGVLWRTAISQMPPSLSGWKFFMLGEYAYTSPECVSAGTISVSARTRVAVALRFSVITTAAAIAVAIDKSAPKFIAGCLHDFSSSLFCRASACDGYQGESFAVQSCTSLRTRTVHGAAAHW